MTGSSWDIRPFDGVGDIRFGSSREAVREALGIPVELLRRPAWSGQVIDGYLDRGVFCSYDRSGMLAAVELFGPARAVFAGIDLLGRAAGEVLAEVRLLPGIEFSRTDPLHLPTVGLSFALRGASGLENRAQSVTACAQPGPDEPVFFPAGTSESAGLLNGPIAVDGDRLGPVGIGEYRETVRAALGEGMATTFFGTDADVFFCGFAVEYGADGKATRIALTQHGASLADLPVTLGRPLSTCLLALAERSIAVEEQEAGILLCDLGVALLTARADPSLPIAAVSVGT